MLHQVDRYDINQSSSLGIGLIGSIWPYPVPANTVEVVNATMLVVTADFDVK